MAIPYTPVIDHGRATLSSLRLETSFSSPDVPTHLLDTPLIDFYLFLCSTDWLIGSWGAFLLVFIRARELPCVRFSSSGVTVESSLGGDNERQMWPCFLHGSSLKFTQALSSMLTVCYPTSFSLCLYPNDFLSRMKRRRMMVNQRMLALPLTGLNLTQNQWR